MTTLAPVPAEDLPATTPRDVPLGASWFRVLRGGAFDGRPLHGGDLVACVPRAGVGDAVVLVPVGRGAPRLGHVRREGLVGDAGDPCDPARWSVAGRVVRVVRGALPVDARSDARSEDRAALFSFRGVPLGSSQLALFGA
jgi:hypothetical protein